MIPLHECEDGALYRLAARRIQFGIFRADTKQFEGIRYKFGNRFIDAEYHWDTGPPFGTVQPLVKLPDRLPVDADKLTWLLAMEERYGSGGRDI